MWPFGGRFFPGTNLQDLNLDWIVQRVRDLSRGIIAPFINTANNHWMVWDTDAETFVDSGVSAAGEGTGPQGEPGKSPIIGSNGHWYVWDVDTSAYTDTGIDAQGPAGPTGPTGPQGPQGERGPGQNRNLLDNWYFVGGGSQLGDSIFPINQRGQASYSLGENVTGIDRWKFTKSSASEAPLNIVTNDNYITLSKTTTGNARFIQEASNFWSAGTYTISILVNSVTISEGASNPYICLLDPENYIVTGSRAYITESGLFTATFNLPNIAERYKYSKKFGILVPSGVSIEIIAVKLELSSTQTLAHQENGTWVLNELPDYGEELLKCQRYFQMFRTEALRPTYALDCRPVMAGEPTPGTMTLADVTYYTLTV